MALKAEEVYAILKKQIQSGGTTPEQIQQAVDNYLTENPVTAGVLSLDGNTVKLQKERIKCQKYMQTALKQK